MQKHNVMLPPLIPALILRQISMRPRWLPVFMLAFLPWLTACANAPSSWPFEVQKAGNKVEIEYRAVEHRGYLFDLRLMYKEGDREDRERVRKLAGRYEKDNSGKLIEPGVPILLRFKISVIDASGERLILDQEISELRKTSHGADSFNKRIIEVPLKPGRYRISVESLKDVPELFETPVIFSIGFYAKSDPIK